MLSCSSCPRVSFMCTTFSAVQHQTSYTKGHRQSLYKLNLYQKKTFASSSILRSADRSNRGNRLASAHTSKGHIKVATSCYFLLTSNIQPRKPGRVFQVSVKAQGKTEAKEIAPAIDIEKLCLSLNGIQGKTPVLRDCTLSVPKGGLWMLLGPNGCGKSTLLRALAGLLRPSSGRMRVVAPRSFVFQNPDHQVVMPTVGADVAFGLGRLSLPEEEVRQRVNKALVSVGMADYVNVCRQRVLVADRRLVLREKLLVVVAAGEGGEQRAVQTLSGGQKQRVAIAGALAEDSQVLLLDELTTFLDGADQVSVLEAVRDVIATREGVTALWVTHRLEELAYADGAAYMEDGQVVVSGDVAEVRAYIKKQQESVLGV
eukprot:jgi/Mesen1/7810/ME000413S07067